MCKVRWIFFFLFCFIYVCTTVASTASSNQEVIDKIPEKELLGLKWKLQWNDFLCSAVPSVQHHNTHWPDLLTLNCSDWLSITFLAAVWVSSPPDPHSFSETEQLSASLLGVRLNPHLHNCLGIFSQTAVLFFFLFLFCLFSGAAPCRSAPPLLSFLLEVSTMTNSGEAGVYSAPVPGVMWAGRPLLLAVVSPAPDCVSSVPSAPPHHHRLM